MTLSKNTKAELVSEVKKLSSPSNGPRKISHQRLQQFGLEYRFVSLFLQNKISYNDMVWQLKNAIHKFSKRQMTWFKTDKRIRWITSQKQAERLVKSYLKW